LLGIPFLSTKFLTHQGWWSSQLSVNALPYEAPIPESV